MIFALVCNFKMNTVDLKNYFSKISKYENYIVCPNYIQIKEALANKKGIKVGAQNVCETEEKAFTGETSVSMLKEIGVNFCIVGHSERRYKLGETDESVAKKIDLLLSNKITPILCVGETEKSDFKTAWQFIKKQLKSVVNKKVVVAYEPVFSIGTGNIPTVEHISKICESIKKYVKNDCVLYGGSFNEKNCEEIIKINSVDGALIGGAGLKVDAMNKVIDIIKEVK